ncbi:otoancorin-like, partial [Anneissia japonica]|uniref:otoancorin-like n=1 Tax=Anneissia japonica TaxID=1529436 RepID=UPI00142576CF
MGTPDIADITLNEKRYHLQHHRNSTQITMSFKEAYIPNTLLKRLSNSYIANLTAAEVKVMMDSTDMSINSVQHIFSNLNHTVFQYMMNEAASDESVMDIPEMYYHPMIDAGINQFGPVSQWTPDQALMMKPFLQGLTKEHIKELGSETFHSILPSLEELLEEEEDSVEHSVQMVVMQKYKKLKGPVIRWSIEDLAQVKAFITTLTRRDIKSIPDQVIDKSLDVVESRYIASNPKIGRDYLNRITNLPTWSWSMENVTRLGDLVQFVSPRDMARLPASIITMDVFTSKVQKQGKESRLIARKVVEQRGDPSAWSADDLRSVGRSVGGLDVKDIEKIPAEAILGAMDDLNKAEMSPRQKKTLLKKVKRRDSGRLSADDIKNLKGLSTMLKTDELKELRSEEILEAADTFREIGKDLSRAKRKEIVQKASKAENDVGTLIGSLGEDYVAEIPLKSVRTMTYSDITSMSVATGNNRSTGASEVKWTRSQSKSLYRSIKRGLEEIEGDEVIFTTDIIRTLGTIAAGLPCDDIHKMAGDDVVSLVTALMEQDGWNNKQMRCIKDTIKDGNADFTSSLTEGDITNLGGRVLKEFSVDDLGKIPEHLQGLTFEQIGSTELTEDKKEKRKWMAKISLKVMNKTGDKAINSDDLLSLGNLTCSMPAEAYTRIENEAFSENVYSLRECFLDQEQMGAIRDKLKDVNGEPGMWSSDAIATAGPLLASLSEDELMQLDHASFSSVAMETLNSFKEFNDRKANRVIDTDEDDERKWKQGFTGVAIRTKDALVADTESALRRKKREVVHSPTCEEILDLQDGNIAWTVQELEVITTDTFQNCFDTLGSVSGFSEDQLDVLLNKAIETWGSVRNISSDDIALLGHIATRFTPEQISALDLSDIDTLYTVGQFDGWQTVQLESGLNRFLQLSGWHISDLNATDLTGLSNFLCGMSLDQMLDISSESYGGASSDIGKLSTCTHQRLSVLKDKAVDVYGEIASWLPEIYTEVGTVVAGFSSSDFTHTGEETLAGVLPEALALIPSDTFRDVFSAELVGYFDQYQAQAITAEQRSMLSSRVLDSLNAAEYGGDATILSQ